jgi:hypothetical protein
MTSGGRTARPARRVQPDSDVKLLAMAAVQTAETQTVATVALIDRSCIFQVYRPALNGAVPECTRKTTDRHIRPFGASRAAEEQDALQVLRCAIDNSGEQLYSLQSGDGRWWRHVENHMLLIVGAVIVLIAVVIIPRMRVSGGMNASTLGWMSEQWARRASRVALSVSVPDELPSRTRSRGNGVRDGAVVPIGARFEELASCLHNRINFRLDRNSAEDRSACGIWRSVLLSVRPLTPFRVWLGSCYFETWRAAADATTGADRWGLNTPPWKR